MNVVVRIEKEGTLWLEATLLGPWGEESDPLLDLLEPFAVKAGRKMPYGCRSGSCGTCGLEVVAGGDLLMSPAPIEEDTLSSFSMATAMRLACRSRLRADANGQLLLKLPQL